MIKPPSELRQFSSLMEIVKALRGPDGCPWDKEQTHRSLTPFAIEEAHELAEAIEADSLSSLKLADYGKSSLKLADYGKSSLKLADYGKSSAKLDDDKSSAKLADSKVSEAKSDASAIVSELGDLLLQVALHSEIGRQSGRFTIEDVLESINSKMVRRHPHVFAETVAVTSEAVLNNWAEIKAQEKKTKPAPTDRFDISPAMPALARAQKIGDKSKHYRFDWSSPEDVLTKVDEEILEVKEEMVASPRDAKALEHEIGDVLFSVAQLARHLGLEAEQCLRTANQRFEMRFFTMREQIAASGRSYESLSTQELEEAWQTVKRSLSMKE